MGKNYDLVLKLPFIEEMVQDRHMVALSLSVSLRFNGHLG